MNITAYILVADPAWIEESVLSFYDMVEKIVVSYDENAMGWTGVPVPINECLARLRAIDRDGKMVYMPGCYARLSHEPMENETYQRQCALEQAADGADWILQLDTDEILPDPAYFKRAMEKVSKEYNAVDWPMRTFFQRTKDGRFLEVCSLFRKTISSYPGPIAVRPGTKFAHARQPEGKSIWRYDVRAKDTDTAAGHRPVHCVVDECAAILHFSWVRREDEIQRKLNSWGHSAQFDGTAYLNRIWKKAPMIWPFLFRFHPMAPAWWPALRPVDLSGVLGSMKCQEKEALLR